MGIFTGWGSIEVVKTVVGNRFVLIEPLGAGGSGCVYRARQEAVDRDVAVKILTAQALLEDQTRARFLREARIVANLRCPYTVKLYDFGALPDGGLYIAMELVEGVTLERLLEDQGAVDLDTAATWIAHVGESLREAHQAGIVHRDLKPANIMIEPGRPGRARLLDFGIAKAARENQSITALGDIFGTPAYMAPESWSSDFGEVGPRTDVYALGVLLVELLTGRLPFDGGEPARLMRAYLYEAPRLPGAIRLDLRHAREVDRIVSRCLSKSPADRFGDATEPAIALSRLGASPGPASGDIPPERTARARSSGLWGRRARSSGFWGRRWSRGVFFPPLRIRRGASRPRRPPRGRRPRRRRFGTRTFWARGRRRLGGVFTRREGRSGYGISRKARAPPAPPFAGSLAKSRIASSDPSHRSARGARGATAPSEDRAADSPMSPATGAGPPRGPFRNGAGERGSSRRAERLL